MQKHAEACRSMQKHLELPVQAPSIFTDITLGQKRLGVTNTPTCYTMLVIGNTKGGSITVPLTSCLIGLDQTVLQIKTKTVSCLTVNSKPVKKEVNGTVILPPLVFPASHCDNFIIEKLVANVIKHFQAEFMPLSAYCLAFWLK